MSWESLDWKPADGQTLGAGASILALWPMLKSAIAESIAGDALCPVEVSDLAVARITADEAPTPLQAARSLELLGTDRRGSWAALDPARGSVVGGKAYTAGRLQDLVMDALDSSFEALLGEGLSLGQPIESPASGAPLLLLRLSITTSNGEQLMLISAYDAEVANELSAHVVALQALGSEPLPPVTSSAPAPVPAAAPVPAPAAPVPTAPASAPASSAQGGSNGHGASPALPSNVKPAQLPELTQGPVANGGYNIDMLLGVSLQVAVEIGRTTLAIRDVLALTPGSIIELDKLAGEKVDILINGRAIAQGEIVVVDENFGVRITDVVARQQRLTPASR